jgi:hypothetical protein
MSNTKEEDKEEVKEVVEQQAISGNVPASRYDDYYFVLNQIYSGIPIPERVRVRRASLHDANGNPGGTSLFPMRHNLHALMLHEKVSFRSHGSHTFIDINAIMYW